MPHVMKSQMERINKSRISLAERWRNTRYQAFFFVVSILFFFFVSRLVRPASVIKNPTPIQLHNNAFSAAASIFARLAHVHLAFRGTRTKSARSGWVRRHLFVVSTDLTDKVIESVFDIDARLGGCLDELAAELTSQVVAL